MSTADILSKFVARNDDPRDFLRKPIIRDGFIYATNGHVVIRIKECQGIEAVESDQPKNMHVIFDENVTTSFRLEFPVLPPPDTCRPCQGSGQSYRCLSCNGQGVFEHYGHDYDCLTCDGTGQVKRGKETDKIDCWFCDGTGHQQQRVIVDDKHFDRRYLAKLKDLPGIRFSSGITQDSPAYFVFDDGDGLLMPMRK